MSCVVWGCSSHSGRKEIIQGLLSFHRFPADDIKKKEWLIRINRPNLILRKYSRVCSKHFTGDSFNCVPNSKYRRLREDATPTLNIMNETDEMNPVTNKPVENQSQQYLRTILHHTQESGPSISHQSIFHGSQDCVPMNFEIAPSTSSQISAPKQCHQTSSQIQELLMQINQYKEKIQTVEKKLENTKKVSKRRLRKINTLTKLVSRLRNKNEDLYSILMKRLRKKNIEIEYIKK